MARSLVIYFAAMFIPKLSLLVLLVAVGICGCNLAPRNSTSAIGVTESDSRILNLINEFNFPVTVYFSLDFGRHFSHVAEVKADGSSQMNIDDWMELFEVPGDEGQATILTVAANDNQDLVFQAIYSLNELRTSNFFIRINQDLNYHGFDNATWDPFDVTLTTIVNPSASSLPR